MGQHWIVLGALALIGLGCQQTHMEDVRGGETHFLSDCRESVCAEGLECICGVCTKVCTTRDVCDSLDSEAGCYRLEPESLVCREAMAPARMCDVDCTRDEECSELGAGFRCVENGCRPASIATAIAEHDAGADEDPEEIPEADAGCSDDECGAEVKPLVMLIVDTSGSMERTSTCLCTTPACSECLPRCGDIHHDKNRWTTVLEALTGTFDDFTCEEREREAPLATYDEGYYLPYHEPHGVQRDDGVLDAFKTRLRFGSATFDGWDTYIGAPPLVTSADFNFIRSNGVEGLFSYSSYRGGNQLELRANGSVPGAFHYPNSTTSYFMDTGIRSELATEGALTVAINPGAALDVVTDIKRSLRDVRPYGGTPIAASLDDVRAYFEHDPAARDERLNPERTRHVVLITDGYPDDDYRSYGCNCAFEGSEPDRCGVGSINDPQLMQCPYPTAEEGARALLCAHEFGGCASGLVEAVHVVGLSIDDSTVTDRLNAIAAEGGTTRARFATDTTSLREALTEILEQIAD